MTAGAAVPVCLVDDLADPADVRRRYRPPGWWRQSLARGALGVTLLHVERARTGRGSWRTAHAWLAEAVDGPVDDGPGSHLQHGAPALGYVLWRAAVGHPDRYARARHVLDTHVAAVTTCRVDAAHRRIDAGRTPALFEFDTLRGLTGLGVYWLRRDPDGLHLRRVLDYLVRLTEPLPAESGTGDRERPGWWTHVAPNGRLEPAFPDGHANNGVSHGIAGPLALLALAVRSGHRVPDQEAAIYRILDWLDRCQRHDAQPTWWPYWTTTADLGNPVRRGRPSWCYGALGIARAQQLAGLALGDRCRVRDAETAILATAADAQLPEQLNDPGICHGLAGALLVIRRAAADSVDDRLRMQATRLSELLADLTGQGPIRPTALGLLDGASGTALALADEDRHDQSGWDRCLLTS